MKWSNFYLKFFLVFYLPCVFGLERVVKSVVVTPTQETYQSWVQDLFQMQDELWFIIDPEAFEASLENLLEKSPVLLDKIKSQFIKPLDMNGQQMGARFSYYQNIKKNGDLEIRQVGVIAAELKMKISNSALKGIYSELYSQGVSLPTYSQDEIGNVHRLIDHMSLDVDSKNILKQQIFHSQGQYHLALTSSNWGDLPLSFREEYVGNLINNKIIPVTTEGVSVDYIVSNTEDIEKLASQFSNGDDFTAAELESKLLKQWKLRSSSQSSITIPLESLLPEFVQRNIYTYALTDGPNCLNATICTHKAYYQPGYSTGEDLVLTFPNPLKDPLKPSTGDAVIYTNRAGGVVHSAMYIDDDIVFTKNGISRFSPYIFQYREMTDKAYASFGPPPRLHMTCLKKALTAEFKF